MLISKYKNKLGHTNISIVVSEKELTPTKSANYYRITLNENFDVHLDEKHKLKVKDVFNLDRLIDNTVPKK